MVVETKLARFVAMVEILEAKQIAFKASVKNDVQTMKQNIKEHAEGVLEAAEAGQKIHALRDFLMEETQRTTSGIAKQEVNQAAKNLNEAGHELQSALKREMQGLKHLLTECNTGLFTGVGSDNLVSIKTDAQGRMLADELLRQRALQAGVPELRWDGEEGRHMLDVWRLRQEGCGALPLVRRQWDAGQVQQLRDPA